MSAEKFVDHLESQGLLEPALVKQVRQKIARSSSPVKPEAVAKMLVDAGHLTAFLAKKALTECGAAAATAPTEKSPSADKTVTAVESDDLGLALLDDAPAPAPAQPSKPAPAKPAASKPAASKPTEKPAAEKPAAKPGLDRPPTGRGDGAKSDGGKPAFKGGGAVPPAAGLQPLGSSGLAPLSDPLSPLGDVGGLTPVGAGLAPLDAGLSPMGMAPSGALGSGLGGATTPEATPSEKPQFVFRKKESKTFSTSMLVLFGVPGLLLLLFMAWVLISRFTLGNAKEQFERAESSYKAESYAQAIKEYEAYIKGYPTGEDASPAKVRRGLARMRLATDGARDFQSALDTAQKVLEEVDKEPAFAMARDELSALLPRIANGFATQAKDAIDRKKAQDYINFADQAMELVNNPSYIPTKSRDSIQKTLDDVNRKIALAKRTIQKDEALEEALATIGQLTAANNTVEAYAKRANLLKSFPELEVDAKLATVIEGVTERERTLVRPIAEPKSAEAAVVEPNDVARIVPSRRIGQPLSGTENQVAFVLVRGSVFAFDATSGQILWRRFVGQETLIQPVAASKLAGADAIVSDTSRNQLIRVKARTGEPVWNFSVGEPFAAPVVVDDRILVSALSGRVYQIDLETGNSPKSTQIPQKVTVGIGGNPRVEHVFQVGHKDNIYVLNPETLACEEVFYLGHRPGSIAIPPLLVLQHLFVVENAGNDYCLLHILRTDESGRHLKRPGSEAIRMVGNVVIPLVHTKNRVTVLTNFGELRVFSVDPQNEERPVKTDASMIAPSKSPIPGYPIVDGAMVVVGGDRLSLFDIQTAREQLNRRWSLHESETFIAPMQKIGNAVIHTRRRRGSEGVTVSAATIEKGEMIWRNDIAIPSPVLNFEPARNQVVGITSLGDVYRVPAQTGLVDRPNEMVEVDGAEVAYAFSDPTPLSDGRIVLSNQRDRAQVLLFNPQQETSTSRAIRMDIGDAKALVPPVALGAGVVMPLDSGQVQLFSPENGKALVLPFQPETTPGTKVAWRKPVVAGNEVFLTDGQQRLFRVVVKDQPQPHLEAIASGKPVAELLETIAVAGDTVYGVVRGASGDMIQAFNRNDFAPGKEIPLTGRLTAGPWQAGDVAILASSKEGLICLDAGQNVRWQSPLNYGPLAGPPRVESGNLLLTSQSGTVWRVALADGVELDRVELGEPLLGSAISLPAGGILATASDGTWLTRRGSTPNAAAGGQP